MKKKTFAEYITLAFRAFFGIVILVCITYFVLYVRKHYGNGSLPKKVHTISNWTMETDTMPAVEITLPITADVEVGETVRFKSIVPDYVQNGYYLGLLNSKNINITIDGRDRYNWRRENADVIGGPTHASYFFVALRQEDAGKEIVITKYGNTFNGGFDDFVIGDSYSVLSYFRDSRGPLQFIFALFIFFLSLVLVVFGMMFTVLEKKSVNIITAGLAVMTASAWLITDSLEFQLFFGIRHIDGFIAYILAMTMAFPFLAYIDGIQKYRYKNFYTLLCFTELINFIACTTLHVTGTVNFYDLLTFMNGIMGVIVVSTCSVVIYDMVIGKAKEYRRVAYGLLAFMTSCIIELIFLKLDKPWIDGLFMELGLLLLLCSAVLQQIIDLYNMEKERNQVYEANAAKSEFLTNMSHEIRTPINAILGMNEMIMQENQSSLIREYAEHIGHAGQLLLSMVNEVLDYSALQNGEDMIVNADYKPRQMIESVTAVLRDKATAKGLGLNIGMPGDLPLYLNGDERHIVRILANICSNAVKFTEKGNVTFAAECTYDEEKGNYILEFYIKDSGVGIPKEELNNLFSAFSRADIKKNRSVDGAGLGLAIVKSLLDDMGGTIEVTSEVGEGSTFIVRIPQNEAVDKHDADTEDVHNQKEIIGSCYNGSSDEHDQEIVSIFNEKSVIDSIAKNKGNANNDNRAENVDNSVANKEDVSKAFEHSMDKDNNNQDLDNYSASYEAPKAHVLAVDDNNANLIVVKEFLKKSKVILDMATGGDEAITKCQSTRYDIILMDHMMPEPDGIEAMHVIRESLESINRKTPIIVLTANVIGDCKNNYICEGFDGYLSKPVDRTTLLKTIRKFVNSELIVEVEPTETQEEKQQASSDEKREDNGIIDFDELIERFEGQKSVADMILGECVKEGERKIVLLRELFDEKDIKRYGIEAHGVKGVMASVCAKHFSAHAKEHEFAAKEDRIDFIEQDIDSFLDEYRQVLEFITQYLKGEGIDVKVPKTVSYDGDNKSVEELIDCIKQALDDFDVDEALKHISHLADTIDEDKKSIVEEVRQYAEDFEYDKALECLEKL